MNLTFTENSVLIDDVKIIVNTVECHQFYHIDVGYSFFFSYMDRVRPRNRCFNHGELMGDINTDVNV